jgi:hypothetical protein
MTQLLMYGECGKHRSCNLKQIGEHFDKSNFRHTISSNRDIVTNYKKKKEERPKVKQIEENRICNKRKRVSESVDSIAIARR